MIHPYLIDTDTLTQNLGREDLVIIDVRGQAAYLYGGHIPGSVHSTWHEYSDPEAAAKGVLDPNLERLEKKLQALGIHDDSDVVIYSNPFDNWGDEGRMFWMLQYLGLTNLKVLDGGWVKWVAEQRPFEFGAVRPKPGTVKVHQNPQVIVMKDEIKRIIKQPHPAIAVVDARSLEEYAGKDIQGLPRSGHIPTAISLPWNGFLNQDATMKELEAIQGILEEKGLQPSHEVICYCTGGVRSAWLYFVLTVAGYSRVRNYPGSWWEWSRDFAAPVEKDVKLLYTVTGASEGKPS